ncbi:MAG: hypothetical protein EOP06_02730 [Proteobacteria bacterium]|nr:MAG: hypothetical protein EOP06_02730 [Pseudomonadota bacterium]
MNHNVLKCGPHPLLQSMEGAMALVPRIFDLIKKLEIEISKDPREFVDRLLVWGDGGMVTFQFDFNSVNAQSDLLRLLDLENAVYVASIRYLTLPYPSNQEVLRQLENSLPTYNLELIVLSHAVVLKNETLSLSKYELPSIRTSGRVWRIEDNRAIPHTVAPDEMLKLKDFDICSLIRAIG